MTTSEILRNRRRRCLWRRWLPAFDGCNQIPKSGPLTLMPVIPAKAQGCPGKILWPEKGGNRPLFSSWPDLSRPSTPSCARSRDVDARVTSAQDDFGLLCPIINQLSLQRNFPRTALRFREDDEFGCQQDFPTASFAGKTMRGCRSGSPECISTLGVSAHNSGVLVLCSGN